MPAEVLAEILLLVPVADRVSASEVCKHWYRIVRSSPHLWTSIVFDTDLSKDLIHGVRGIESVRAMLRLSRQSNVRLDITIQTNDHCVRIVPILKAAWIRCVDFRLAVDIAEITHASRCALTQLIATPAPRITILAIFQANFQSIFEPDLVFSIFSNYFAALQYLEYDGDIALLLWSSVALSNLTVANVSLNDTMNPRLLGDLLQLLKSCKDVTLGILDWDDDHDHNLVQVPDGIMRLHFRAECEPLGLPNILNSLALPLSAKQVLGVTVETGITGDTEIAVTSVFRNLVEIRCRSSSDQSKLQLETAILCASLYWAPEEHPPEHGVNVLTFPVDEEMHSFISFNSNQHPDYREINGERRAYSYHGRLEFELFSRLRRLYVSESVFDPTLLPNDLPSFPSLVHLLIWPMPDRYHRMDCGESAFFSVSRNATELLDVLTGIQTSPHPAPRILHCPSLKFLTLLGDKSDWSDHWRPRLTPDMVASFVRERLQFEATRLKQIAMLGVELLIYDPLRFDNLLHITDEVVCDEQATIWVVNMPLIEVN